MQIIYSWGSRVLQIWIKFNNPTEFKFVRTINRYIISMYSSNNLHMDESHPCTSVNWWWEIKIYIYKIRSPFTQHNTFDQSITACKNLKTKKIVLWKVSLKSDGKQFHQYKKNEQSHLLIKHIIRQYHLTLEIGNSKQSHQFHLFFTYILISYFVSWQINQYKWK